MSRTTSGPLGHGTRTPTSSPEGARRRPARGWGRAFGALGLMLPVLPAAGALGLLLPILPAHAAPPSRGTPPTAGRPSPGANPRTSPGGTELTGDEGDTLAHNVCKKQPRGAKFKITLPKEAELQDLVNWMMSVSCQKFIWDTKVRSGKVTILSPEAVTIEEAYAAFYSGLETMGLTVEPSGEYFKIVETAEASTKTLPVYGPGAQAPNNDRYVTQLKRLKGGNTKDVVDLLTKMKTKQGSVQNVGDLIILTDTGSSVRRLLRIMNQLDDPAVAGEKIFFYQLQYADPEEVAEILRGIFGEKQASAAPKTGRGRQAAGAANDSSSGIEFSRVIVDDRTGTLIIVAEDADYGVIRRLIEQLDVPLAGGGGRVHVHKLKNADPEEVANVLTQLGSGAQQGGRSGGGAGGRPANQPPPQGGQTADLFSGEIKVTADPATRSLVILASSNDMRALRPVIDELDAERKQIYIEVYLLELAISKSLEGGAAGHFGTMFDTAGGQGIGFVASAPGQHNSVILDTSILSGLAAGVLGPQIPGSGQFLGTGVDIPAFGVIIQALQNDNDVNLVAEPHLYTADNQEALIEVGRNVPTPGAVGFPGGGQAGGLVPFQSVQRQDVTLNVKITPHINDLTQEPKTVTLDIELENNDIESIDPQLGVTTTKRRLKLDKVVARDDQPLVLGGLVQEVERESTQQVPGLGSIPLLGWLFKRKSRRREKVNLLMVLVPHILETPDDAKRIHQRRMQERFEFLERETAFKRKDLPTHVNYRKKSGLLASINHEARRMDEEAEFRMAAESELHRHVISGEIGLSPARGSADDEEPDASGAGGTPTPTPPPGGTAPRPRPRRGQ
jgi:general secretion pathway protein D